MWALQLPTKPFLWNVYLRRRFLKKILTILKKVNGKLASQTRKTIRNELKNIIFSSTILSFFAMMGSGTKVLLTIFLVFKNNEECVSPILIYWFSFVFVHDLANIVYNIIYIRVFVPKNEKLTKKELNKYQEEIHHFQTFHKLNVTLENKTVNEQKWFRSLRVLIFWYQTI